jgi:uncharacterized NAD(P)/FAD-binding protein YdhS
LCARSSSRETQPFGASTAGSAARAAFWETIAVPDIRKRIEALVESLSNLQISASK